MAFERFHLKDHRGGGGARRASGVSVWTDATTGFVRIGHEVRTELGWKYNQRMIFLVGSGEDEGKIAIRPDDEGRVKLFRPGPAAVVARIVCRPIALALGPNFQAAEVEYETRADTLIITLPKQQAQAVPRLAAL